MNEDELIRNAFNNIPTDSKIFISKLGDIADRVEQILAEKGWSQKDLAQAMGKQESEISKWLTTIHNFTLRSIAKMESVLGADIVQIPLSGELQTQTRYIYITTKAGSNNISAELFDETPLSEDKSLSIMKEFIAKSTINPYSPVALQDLVRKTTPKKENPPVAA